MATKPQKAVNADRGRGRPRTTGTNVMIAIRWPPQVLDAIDRYAQQQMIRRPAALRQIVVKYLVQHGKLKGVDIDGAVRGVR